MGFTSLCLGHHREESNLEVVKVLTYGSGQREGSGQEGLPRGVCGSGAASVPAMKKTESLGVTLGGHTNFGPKASATASHLCGFENTNRLDPA